ncbi:MAG: YgiQ family radical SAM protein [Oscillospiraceae bacterium]|nr:YgiQ family radical SAM protein [Oscillospiraceae bacterium]
MNFLPVCGNNFDFICITGDAYVDHPSFGVAIISRVIESCGFSVAIIPQPLTDDDYKKCGIPKYGFMVTSGNIDSMVANYTAAKRKRSNDNYSDEGKSGKRPDRALTVYCKNIRRLFGNIHITIGGIEASLRRFAHYDYWADKVMPSVLVDTSADILVYGMGEYAITTICKNLRNNKPLTDIRGTCYLTEPKNTPLGAVECPPFDQVATDKKKYAIATRKQYDEQDEHTGKTIIQRQGEKMLVQLPPSPALTQEDMDRVYALPYTRTFHPMYKYVPAIEEVKYSITHNRGCFGFCNFCSLALHQGRKITCRSKDSVVKESENFTKDKDFKGYIHDIGGPTANFRHSACDKKGMCKGKKCLAPVCKNIKVSHNEYIDILRSVRKIKGIKKVFIRSGIRYDYLLLDKPEVLNEIVEHHISGQLKVAPEHCTDFVLDKMGKPHIETFLRFKKRYFETTKRLGKEQYLVPYLMSSHPGSTLNAAIDLALFLKKEKIRPEQVQDFYPTPGTISTAMYYTELDPYTLEKIYVPKTSKEKAMQRALLQYYEPKNRALVTEALKITKRQDLIPVLLGANSIKNKKRS